MAAARVLAGGATRLALAVLAGVRILVGARLLAGLEADPDFDLLIGVRRRVPTWHIGGLGREVADAAQRRRRLAIRGVPRDRRATSTAASGSSGQVPSLPAYVDGDGRFRVSQFAAKRGPAPGTEFGPGGLLEHMKLETLQTAMDFTIVVEYVGPEANGEVFEATVVGLSTEY